MENFIKQQISIIKMKGGLMENFINKLEGIAGTELSRVYSKFWELKPSLDFLNIDSDKVLRELKEIINKSTVNKLIIGGKK